MPNYVIRDVPPDIWSRFTERAKLENWPLRALFIQMMNDFADGRHPNSAPPEQMPIYAWVRPYYRTLARRQNRFLDIDTATQWDRLVHYIREQNPHLVGSLEQIPAERRPQVLTWLRETSEDLKPGPTKLSLRPIAHIGSGPSLNEGRRVIQYEVVGLQPGEQAFIFDQPHQGWQVLRLIGGQATGGGWHGHYATAQDALRYLEDLLYLETDQDE